MIRHALHALLAILLVSVVSAQARLDGVWQGETNGGRALTLTLAVKADTLTGTLTRDQETTTITDGKVTGQTFSFKATLGEQQESLSGRLNGDELEVWLDRQGPSAAVVLRRSTRK
jgi:hypothetical protein